MRASVILAFLLLLASPLVAGEVTGLARVVDGDSLRIEGRDIRLFGIDAPEYDQTCISEAGVTWACGQEVTEMLRKAVSGQRLRCDLRGKDCFGRDLAICHLGRVNLNAWLVEEGWAFAFRKYSMMFDLEEKAAAVNRRGLHGQVMERPSDFRAANSARSNLSSASPAPAHQTGDCRIKGNISGNGKIYHLPGQEHYDRTRISPRDGERWFCTEAEAQAAGWRRARR